MIIYDHIVYLCRERGTVHLVCYMSHKTVRLQISVLNILQYRLVVVSIKSDLAILFSQQDRVNVIH